MKDNSSTNVRHRPWVNMSTGLCPAGRAGVLRAELGGTRVVLPPSFSHQSQIWGSGRKGKGSLPIRALHSSHSPSWKLPHVQCPLIPAVHPREPNNNKKNVMPRNEDPGPLAP